MPTTDTDRLYHGPMRAMWRGGWINSAGIRLPVIVAGVGEIAHVRSYVAQVYGRTSTPTFVTRTECCPVPGCDGIGRVWNKANGALLARAKACPAHVATVETDEPADAWLDRLDLDGAEASL